MSLENLLRKSSSKYGFSFGIQSIDKLKSSEYLSRSIKKLTISELEQFDSLKNEKRKFEWISGRLASKKALKNFLVNKDEIVNYSITVINGENNAPYISEYPHLKLSISHSDEYAIALVSNSCRRPPSPAIPCSPIRANASTSRDRFLRGCSVPTYNR